MESIHLIDFLNIIKKKKILFLNFFLGTLTIALAINALQKPVYKTSVEILVERSQPEVLLTGEGYRFSVDKTFFQTQFRLLKSDNILEKLNYTFGSCPCFFFIGSHFLRKNFVHSI